MPDDSKACVDELRRSIKVVFADVKRPERSEIAPHDCFECEGIRSQYAELEWQALGPKELRGEYDYSCLSLFSPQAYRYFLPAFLLAALDILERAGEQLWADPDDDLVECLGYSLTPERPPSPDMLAWFDQKSSVFSDDQIMTIIAFLVFLGESVHEDDMALAIEYWQGRMKKLRP